MQAILIELDPEVWSILIMTAFIADNFHPLDRET